MHRQRCRRIARARRGDDGTSLLLRACHGDRRRPVLEGGAGIAAVVFDIKIGCADGGAEPACMQQRRIAHRQRRQAGAIGDRQQRPIAADRAVRVGVNLRRCDGRRDRRVVIFHVERADVAAGVGAAAAGVLDGAGGVGAAAAQASQAGDKGWLWVSVV